MTNSQYRYLDVIGPRHTARGVVIKDGHVLLMERWRQGLHYFSIPGGGIEPGESAIQTAEREILEETSVVVKAEREIYKMFDPVGHIHTIFLCKYISGEPKLSPNSEEASEEKRSKGNQKYKPTWIKFDAVSQLPFLYWQPVGDHLVHDITNGWPPKTIELQSAG